jgi:ABC-type transporter Mla maintaining outer membrane lipid asymmetry ATPase subunit MlaF
MKPAPTPAAGPVIQMTGVTACTMRQPLRVAVEAVDWSVAPGDYWILVGLHATGKSDLLMLTAGLTTPGAGEYRLFGQPMPIFEEARLATRLRLGLVFDGGQLFNHLTVAENVALPLCYHQNLSAAAAADRVAALLALAGLTARAERTPGALSHPERRRAGLARALALQPEVLLLDNPLGGLDVREAAWWQGLLERLWAGHEPAVAQPLTLVVTASTLRPWRGHGRQLGLIANRRLEILGGWADAERSTDPLVCEMLAAGQPG